MRGSASSGRSATGAANPLGIIGEVVVTGAATSPDRNRVALRTYTAAYEWDVPDGDVVKAITTTTPRLTPLPDEPQGEAIAYTVDGTRVPDRERPGRRPGDDPPVRAGDHAAGPAHPGPAQLGGGRCGRAGDVLVQRGSAGGSASRSASAAWSC